MTMMHFSNALPLNVFEGRPLLWKTVLKPAAMSFDRQTGQGICILGYPIKEDEGISLPETNITYKEPAIRVLDTNEPDSTKLCISISEPECQMVDLCGGKGSSLGFLSSLISAQSKPPSTHSKFIVPNAFVLTTIAFHLQIDRHNELKRAIDVLTSNGSNIDLQSSCISVVDLFSVTAIEPEVVQSILTAFDVLCENHINQNNGDVSSRPFRVAVRSSAIGEDSAASSAAGQNESFLGCATTDDVLQSVKRCWASLYSYQSVIYRQQNLQPIFTSMAVVMQTMIPSECAGVLFTRHPVNNDPFKILISANYGLGESVVSGKVDPDVYTIGTSYKSNDLRIIKKDLGQKSLSMHMNKDSGRCFFEQFRRIFYLNVY